MISAISELAPNLLWASIALLLVLVLRRPVALWFGAGAAYALWLVPLARFILPPLSLPGPELGAALAIELDLGSSAGAAMASGGLPWLEIVGIFWAGGALAFLVWQGLRYRTFLDAISRSARGRGDWKGLPLVETDAVDGPLALGLLDRRILVPADFEARFTEAERALVLDHEACHHRRGDIWANFAALAFLAANWFNPIAWIAFAAFREDQELSCDARVTAAKDEVTRYAYGHALVKAASREADPNPAARRALFPPVMAVCPLNHISQLKRRLKMMNHHRRQGALRLAGGVAAVGLLGALSLSLGSAGIAHPHPEGEAKERRIVVIEHKDGERSDHVIRLRRGENGEIDLPEGCREGATPIVDDDVSSGGRRSRILLCSRGNADPAARLQLLERHRERFSESSELNAEQRARVLAAIDAEIARARAGN